MSIPVVEANALLWPSLEVRVVDVIRLLLTSEVGSNQSKPVVSEWRDVRAGSELPFLIEEPEKNRHKVRHDVTSCVYCR